MPTVNVSRKPLTRRQTTISWVLQEIWARKLLFLTQPFSPPPHLSFSCMPYGVFHHRLSYPIFVVLFFFFYRISFIEHNQSINHQQLTRLQTCQSAKQAFLSSICSFPLNYKNTMQNLFFFLTKSVLGKTLKFPKFPSSKPLLPFPSNFLWTVYDTHIYVLHESRIPTPRRPLGPGRDVTKNFFSSSSRRGEDVARCSSWQGLTLRSVYLCLCRRRC